MKYRKQFDIQIKEGFESEFLMAWTQFLNEILPLYPIKDVQLGGTNDLSQKVVVMEFLDEKTFQKFWMNREETKSYISLVKCFARPERLAKEVTVDLFKATQELKRDEISLGNQEQNSLEKESEMDLDEIERGTIGPINVRMN